MKNIAGDYLASLSMNQIDWDGDIDHLPSWDDVAGDPTDYSQTYNPHGNTLALMSMNVEPAHHGLQLPSKMIDATMIIAQDLGVSHLLGSFRPSGYGQAKKEHGYNLDFTDYTMNMRQPGSDKPIDPWLRSLWWKGMEMLKVDNHAMTVHVAMDHFYHYQQTYKPESWQMIEPRVWECGEVGKWNVDLFNGVATYQESNVWGALPIM